MRFVGLVSRISNLSLYKPLVSPGLSLTSTFVSSSFSRSGAHIRLARDITTTTSPMPPKRKPSTRAGTKKKAVQEAETAVDQHNASPDAVEGDSAETVTTPTEPPAKKAKKTTKASGPIPHVPQKELPPVQEGELLLSTFNVNGLRAAIKNGFSKYIDTLEPKPDIMFLQETKGSEADFAAFLHEIEGIGYSVKYNSGSRPGYAGTAVLYNKSVHPVAVKFDSSLAYPKPALGPFAQAGEPDAALVAQAHARTGDVVTQKMRQQMWAVALEEGRVVTTELPHCFVVAAYVPNSGQVLERLDYRTQVWEPVMLEYLCMLESKKPVLYTGDLNVAHEDVDIHTPETNQRSAGFTIEERERCTKMLNSGFCDTFRDWQGPTIPGYTYWSYRFNGRSNNRGWRLDYWLASQALRNAVKGVAVGTEQYNGGRLSDHAPLNIILKLGQAE